MIRPFDLFWLYLLFQPLQLHLLSHGNSGQMRIMYMLHILLHILLDSLARPLPVFPIPFSFLYFINSLVIIGTFELRCVVFNCLVFQFLFQIIFILFLSKLLLIDEVLFMLLLFLFPFFIGYRHRIEVPQTFQVLLPLLVFRFFLLFVSGFVFLIQRIGSLYLTKYGSCILFDDNFIFFPVILTDFNHFSDFHTLIGIHIV